MTTMDLEYKAGRLYAHCAAAGLDAKERV